MTEEETPPAFRTITSTMPICNKGLPLPTGQVLTGIMPIRSKTPLHKLNKHSEDKQSPPDLAIDSAQALPDVTSLQKTTDKKRKLPADADASLKPTAVTGRALSIRTRKKVKFAGPYETLDDDQIRNTEGECVFSC
jgi:hypothetical protein